MKIATCSPPCQLHTMCPDRGGEQCGPLTNADLGRMLQRVTRAAANPPPGTALRSGSAERVLLALLPELLIRGVPAGVDPTAEPPPPSYVPRPLGKIPFLPPGS